MSYGLQISASGAATALYRQDVHANNLANLDSVGFKPDIPSQRPRAAAREEDGLGILPSDRLLERLGGGVLMNPNMIDFGQGSLRPTGNPLDLAIDGDGFFVLQGPEGAGTNEVRFTRDGRFTRDARGRLVSATSGAPVLDTNDRPIVVAPGVPVTVDGEGTLRQAGAAVARLRIVDVRDPGRVRKAGAGAFTAPAAAMGDAATGNVRQGSVEESGVSEIKSLMAVTGASREVEANTSMIQQHDRLMERAINALGRVA